MSETKQYSPEKILEIEEARQERKAAIEDLSRSRSIDRPTVWDPPKLKEGERLRRVTGSTSQPGFYRIPDNERVRGK